MAGRRGLSWKTRQPRFQDTTAKKPPVRLLQPQVPSGRIRIAACRPCCQGAHRVSPLRYHSSARRQRSTWTRSPSSRFAGSGPARTHQYSARGVSPALAVTHRAGLSQQPQPAAGRATQPPPPPPRGSRPVLHSRLCPGRVLAALGLGAALPSYSALSCMLATTARCTAAAERGRRAPSSQAAARPGRPAARHPHNNSVGTVNSPARG